MGLLAGQISALGPQKGLSRQGSTHRSLVDVLPQHALFQYPPQETRDTCISSCGFNPCPARDALLQGDGDVSQLSFHYTNTVYHPLRVKSVQRGYYPKCVLVNAEALQAPKGRASTAGQRPG
jgi:hypothetical protein